MVRVTVLMPVYNGERHLRESIESILAQSFGDFEFLIIDDGSTDTSRSIIGSYHDSRIRCAENGRNIGLARSLNRGLHLARGEYVARQDADDVSESGRLGRQVDFLDHHADTVVLGTWYTKVDEQGVQLGLREPPCDPLEIRWRLLLDVPLVHATVMMRRSTVMEKAGFYDETIDYAEDYDYWLRIARSLVIANLNEYLVRIRMSPSSMTGRYRAIDYIMKIRTANLERMFSETHHDADIRSLDLDVMNRLLIGSRYELEKVEFGKAGQGSEDLLTLHKVFCTLYRLDRSVASRHRRHVSSEVTRRLVELAHLHFYDDIWSVRRTLAKATRMYWPVIFTQGYLRLFGKVLLGPHVVGGIRRFARTGA